MSELKRFEKLNNPDSSNSEQDYEAALNIELDNPKDQQENISSELKQNSNK